MPIHLSKGIWKGIWCKLLSQALSKMDIIDLTCLQKCFGWSFLFSKIVFLILFLGFFGLFENVLFSCDDSLLRLLTSENPEDEFSKGVIDFNQKLSNLGTVLKNRDTEKMEPLLSTLMESWMNFSNKYMVNVPEKARNDPFWNDKMQEAAQRIGSIRKAIAQGKINEAHDTVLGLSAFLGKFFENFGMSPQNRCFLICGQLFDEIERSRLKKDSIDMLEKVSSLTSILATFSANLNPSLQTQYEKTLLSLEAIKNSIKSNPPSDLWTRNELLETAHQSFLNFRAILVAKEWFPGLSFGNASGSK
ncbi:MAG: hypothetical protein HQM08_14705 [Candidatus Riflebacteria bacterium]|nr:hypothetical protein [Candidatus Riflebacteria bacterium]